MDEAKLALKRLQRNIDEYNNERNSTCPVCGIQPQELLEMIELLVKDEVNKVKPEDKTKDERPIIEPEPQPEEEDFYWY